MPFCPVPNERSSSPDAAKLTSDEIPKMIVAMRIRIDRICFPFVLKTLRREWMATSFTSLIYECIELIFLQHIPNLSYFQSFSLTDGFRFCVS